MGFAFIIILIIGTIIVELTSAAFLSIKKYGFSFLYTSTWDPVFEVFGSLPFIFGTLVSSFVAYSGYLGVKNTILFSLSDSMPLTFTVAIATLGYAAHAISHDEYNAFIVASMGSGIFLMILIKIVYGVFYPERKEKISSPPKKG